MGLIRGNRRLGKRSRLYEMLLAPLSVRERFIFLGLILVTVGFFVITKAGASDSLVGSYIYSPFSSCSSPSDNWSAISQATGQPDANLFDTPDYSRAARAVGAPSSLICSNLKLGNHPADRRLVRLYLAVVDEPGPTMLLAEGGEQAERTTSEPKNIISHDSTTAPLDSFLQLELSVDGGKTWHYLTDISSSNVGNEPIDIEIDNIEETDLQDISLRISPQTQTSDSLAVVIDSVGVVYRVSRPTTLEVALIGAQVGEQKIVISGGTNLEAILELDTPSSGALNGLSAILPGVNDQEPQISFTSVLIDQEDKSVAVDTNVEWLGTKVNGNLRWKAEISQPTDLRPGNYQLKMTANTEDGDKVTSQQDVLWGVIAINSAKSSYQPGEPVELMLSVLDERGATICDADITLQVFLNGRVVKTLTTANSDIAVTDTCPLYGNHIQADYMTRLSLGQTGSYDLNITVNQEGTEYTVNDSILVENQSDFVVQRQGPTRIFPVNDYPMNLTLKLNKDFNGTVSDLIPASFKLISQPDQRPYTLNQEDDNQRLTWQVQGLAGDEINLQYNFDAPDVSPAFYIFGHLQMTEDDILVFSESRHWQLAGDAIGRMMVFYDGGSTPSGWTCVSCSGGDPFFQIFPRGGDTYGATGGTATHTHSVTTSVSATGSAAASDSQTGTVLSDNGHSHTGSTVLGSASNLPSYRQLKIIRYDTAGEPSTLPGGTIAMFDSTLPGGWSQYSAQNGYYPRGENTPGTTGGSNTHQHTITGTINAATGGTHGTRNGAAAASANAGHTHTFSGNSSNINSEPPFISVIFAQLGSSAAPPDGMIAMWDDENPSNWSKQSGPAGAFNQNFFKGSATYGTTGGAASHNHVNTNLTSSTLSGGTTNSKSGSSTASSTHTHPVTVSSYSSSSQLPPYRDVVVSKRVPQSDVEQSAYRLYANNNSTDVGATLAAQDTVASSPKQGVPFRLRLLLHVSNANLAVGNRTFKLQYAARSGTCDTSFSGESYNDVDTGSGAIRYADNASPNDGDNLTANANDPSHSGHTKVSQTYEESNNFTNSTADINIGQDGMWDFSMVDFSATASTNYCFRVVRSNGDLLQTYSVIPEIITDDGNGHMLLFYDGGSAPSGWTCVSCNPGDDFYQRYFRGEASYGSTGGTASHTHTASASVGTVLVNGVDSQAGTAISSGGHSHTLMPVFASASNLPTYRQLKIIRANTSGVPTSIPASAIALFDASVPSGWTQYSAQNGNYIRGENTVGSTGGTLSHTHNITGTTSAGSGSSDGATNGPQTTAAVDNHTHAVSGSSSSGSNEPPFIQTVLGQNNSASSAPQNIISLWDGSPPGSWTIVSTSGQPFYQRFVKPAASYGSTGGSVSHNHADNSFNSDVPSSTISRRTGSVNASGTHVHSVSISSVSTSNNLPPYIDVIIAKLGVLNTAPNTPTSLDQKRTSDSSSIAVGDWTNGGQVRFEASVTDPDNPDDLQLCVEVETTLTLFDNVATSCGSSVSYSGTAVTVSVTISGLSNGENYHWQAQAKDGAGATSAWQSFGANLETQTDFAVDSTEPAGTVYDGSSTGIDIDFNDGSLGALSANWNITDSDSGINKFEYSIGTSAGDSDVDGWSDLGTSSSYTATGLNLQTSVIYFWNIRATDNAGNNITLSSDGIQVAPTLTFSASPGTISFDSLNVANSYTDTESAVLTTSTNAHNGYTIRAYVTALPTSQNLAVINLFNGGSYASPDAWLGGDTGYGYTSNDTTIQGANLFGSTPCLGGGSPPCYAPFSTAPPGDIVADHTDLISGTAVANENFVLTHRVTVNPAQTAGTYQTEIIYSVTVRY